ncbi:MAG: hypothetical protein LAN70_17150 [Acidobacteriia bacterium]|nr:hypothetical protein [Terriglobia bacterium]
MSKSVKWLIAALVAITAASVVAMVFMIARRPDTDDEDEVVKAPSRVAVKNGRRVINLDQQTQTEEHIAVTEPAPTSMRAELRGTAMVLPVSDLATLRNNYVAARAKVERAGVDIALSKSSYERIKTLYEQNQNMSLKAKQDAEATYRSNQAQARAAELDAKLQVDTVRQRWGGVVADWIAGDKPVLEPVLEQRDFLVQVIFPPGEVGKPPAGLSLAMPGKQLVQARFVSPFPQVSPQIQGISFLYLVSSRPGLAVGMNLVALVPVGESLRGIVVPQSAIVWWQGKAWAYEQVSPTTFARREVPTDTPVSGGYFVPAASLALKTKLVIVGTQALLSEEFRSEIQQQD